MSFVVGSRGEEVLVALCVHVLHGHAVAELALILCCMVQAL